jgi:hypothetical protein
MQQRLLVATHRYEEAGQVCGNAAKALLEKKHEDEIATFQKACRTGAGSSDS